MPANATPDNFGTETPPRTDKLKPLSRPPTPDKTPRRRLIDGGPEKPQQLQPLHERSQAEAEEPKEEAEPAGKVPPKPWSPRIPAKSRQGPPNDSPTGRLSPPSTDRATPETFPRPLPRMAATLLPSVRPKSATLALAKSTFLGFRV
ncbi:Agbl5 [Symbiodinium sp. CCMP2456]|nr:Agbl5 [Symbiodinium sp. CCMP2456]